MLPGVFDVYIPATTLPNNVLALDHFVAHYFGASERQLYANSTTLQSVSVNMHFDRRAGAGAAPTVIKCVTANTQELATLCREWSIGRYLSLCSHPCLMQPVFGSIVTLQEQSQPQAPVQHSGRVAELTISTDAAPTRTFSAPRSPTSPRTRAVAAAEAAAAAAAAQALA